MYSVFRFLRESFPGYRAGDFFEMVEFDRGSPGRFYVGYNDLGPGGREDRPMFSLNWHAGEKLLYVLDFRVPAPMRGKGVGKALYRAIEAAARVDGIERVELTASGMGAVFWPRCGFLPKQGNDNGVMVKLIEAE